MLDIFDIPSQFQDSVKIYYAQSGSASWQMWTKPRGTQYIWIMCIGGGAGGQAGTGSASAGAASSNGGGAGSMVKALFPASVLPDVLYVQPGLGGAGGIPPSGTSSGNRSFVSIAPTLSAINLVCVSGDTPASGQSGENPAFVSSAGLLSLGTWQATAGGNGGVAGFENRSVLRGTFPIGGCAGGAQSGSVQPLTGGFVDATPPWVPAMDGGTITNINGNNGFFSSKPFVVTSGGGGYGGSGSFGGNGGDGAYGCGGGGGGNTSLVGGTGGRGGRGGDGLVIIATF